MIGALHLPWVRSPAPERPRVARVALPRRKLTGTSTDSAPFGIFLPQGWTEDRARSRGSTPKGKRVKIAVCVKEVPGANAKRRHDEHSKRLAREGDQVLNSYDSHAIEAALQLRESGVLGDDATITAVLMGPASASRTLQKALALGADDALHITDEALAGSDILATGRVLAAAIAKHGPFDLVLLGQQASDSDCWALPGVLAELLEAPVVTQAAKLDVADGNVTVERQTELGYERLKLSLPAVVSVSDAINTPRYPALKAIMAAKKKPLTSVSLADIGIDADVVGQAGSGTTVLAFTPPPPKSGGEKFEDDGSGADKIVEFLVSRNLV
ncbi:MAG: Electron transfer flavoprotein alpha/beta-subunit [Thermoleophilia bacterium]|nr:Electron transfer flavoprotein alpha/beta-subunit [Thermoleophilia bacterium]